MRINFNEPAFDDDDLKSVEEVIKNNFVNEGPKTKELEDNLKEYLGSKHVLLVPNGTAALFLAIKAESIIRNLSDFEVIIPDTTMFATATAVEWAGGRPVVVDVEKEIGLIDPQKVEQKINKKTLAIIPVHLIGRGADMDKLSSIAKENNIVVIEDAAGALGSKYKNRNYLGAIGDYGCFSLQSNKIITCGQGGIVTTNDDSRYEIMKRLRDFGRFNKNEFVHEKVGFNLKFSDLQAALALSQFKKIESRKELLLKQYNSYKEQLKDIGQIKFFDYKEGEIPLWIEVVAENRDELNDFLISKSIFPRKIWPSIHENPPYQNQGSDEDFPNSSYLSKNVLWLPNGPAISEDKLNLVCNEIKDFYPLL